MKNLLACLSGLFLTQFLSAQNLSAPAGEISALRNIQPAFTTSSFFITEPGREGVFIFDPSDKTSADDSVMVLVATGGRRFKRFTDQNFLNVRWFGAKGNGSADDWSAIQKGIDYILRNNNCARTLYFPVGSYKISRPLIIARIVAGAYAQSSINLQGPANAKDIAIGTAIIQPAFNNCFAIGVQLGKGVLISNLSIFGKFTFPNRLNPIQIDTLTADQWTDGSTRQNPITPYAGIVIDPFSDPAVYPGTEDMYPGLPSYYLPGMRRNGSTAVQVLGCSIRNFIVGVMITPSNQMNGDLIDVIDCDLTANKVGYAMGQAQSKECHVDRLKCWGGTHTLFDNVGYGLRHGDGANAPLVDGANIAGGVKQLCRINAASFSGVFRNIYAEELFRLGYVNGNATLSFEDCQINFATRDNGAPYPDFFIMGSGASFHNCMLRTYNGRIGSRILLAGTNNYYEGGLLNEPPVAIDLDNTITDVNPQFRNITMYYSGGKLGNNNFGPVSLTSSIKAANGATDPVYPGNTYTYQHIQGGLPVFYKLAYFNNYERVALLSGQPVLHVDKSKWTAWFRVGKISDTGLLRINDFILTKGLHYRDQYTNLTAATYPVGFIQRIDHDTIFLRNLADGIRDGSTLPLWIDYYVYGNAPFTGNIAAGSDMLTGVQGAFPAVGDRPDMPMLPAGTFVTAVDPIAKTLHLSNTNNTGTSFNDYTFMNGYPAIDIYSSFDIPSLQKAKKTLIGGARFHQYHDKNIPNYGSAYFLNNADSDNYLIQSTNINGDTSLHQLRFRPLEK